MSTLVSQPPRPTRARDFMGAPRKPLVLVVEDHEFARDAVAALLSSMGYDVIEAENGRDALAAMAKGPHPDVILLDLMMPVMDGWEFMSILKTHPEWSDIPVIIVTAIYDAKRTQDETGARAVLTKPFDIDQLTELVSIYSS